MATTDSEQATGESSTSDKMVEFDAPSDDLGYGWSAFKRYWVDMWVDTRWFLCKHWVAILVLTVVVLLWCFYAVRPYDRAWLDFYQSLGGGKKSTTMELANFIGDSGDLAQFNIIVTAGLWFFGRWLKKKNWQRIAMASLMSCLLAGIFCNIFRPTLGRPRPSAQERENLEDRFYGPKVKSHYHGFPSGHTATAFGTAVPVAICAPQIGIPVLGYAGAMAWSRMYQRQHHPTDVIVGGFIGTVFGVAAAAAVRRRNRRHGLLPVRDFGEE